MKRLKTGEIAALCLPPLILGGWAIFSSVRKAPPLPASDKTIIFVDDVVLFHASEGSTPGSGYVYVRVFIDCKGKRPIWWGRTATFWLQSARFTSKDGRVLECKSDNQRDHVGGLYTEYDVRDVYFIPKHFQAAKQGQFEAKVAIWDETFQRPQYFDVNSQVDTS